MVFILGKNWRTYAHILECAVLPHLIKDIVTVNRIFSLSIALVLSSITFSTSQAAPISALFVGSFTSTSAGGDFLGTGVPTPFHLYLTFNDGGTFGSGVLRTQAGVNLATIDTANAGWTLGNGGSDTLNVLAGTSIPNRILNFTLTGPSTTIATNSTANASITSPFFTGSSTLPAAISFTNLLGQGYQGQITAIPEPTTMGLLIGAVACIGVWQRRRSKK